MSLAVEAVGPEHAPAIVFLHGLGVSSWMWTDQIAALSDEYRCFTIDLPGNGLSHDQRWLSVTDSAEQVADVIRSSTADGTAHVVGLSLGGYVALELASAHPELVMSTAVSGVTAGPLTPRPLYRVILAVTGTLARWRPFVGLMARAMKLPEEARLAYVHDAGLVSRETMRRVYREILDHRIPEGIDGSRLLVVAGDREAGAISRSLAEFRRLVPDATVLVAPQAHHAWNGEHPELFTAMVRNHVLRQAPPAQLVSFASAV